MCTGPWSTCHPVVGSFQRAHSSPPRCPPHLRFHFCLLLPPKTAAPPGTVKQNAQIQSRFQCGSFSRLRRPINRLQKTLSHSFLFLYLVRRNWEIFMCEANVTLIRPHKQKVRDTTENMLPLLAFSVAYSSNLLT